MHTIVSVYIANFNELEEIIFKKKIKLENEIFIDSIFCIRNLYNRKHFPETSYFSKENLSKLTTLNEYTLKKQIF